MEDLGRLLLALAAAYTCAMAAVLGARWTRGRFLLPGVCCSAAGCLAAPLLVPAGRVGLRAVAVLASFELLLKLIDFSRPRTGRRGARAEPTSCWFLAPFPVLAVVFPDHRRGLPRPDRPLPHLLWILVGSTCATGGLLIARAISSVQIVQASPMLEHILRVMIFIPVIESLSRVLHALERLAGYDTAPIIRNAFLARNVTDFWQRYNYRVHDWLHRHVFQATGGRRTPARSLLLSFLFSGLFHEAAFALATSRITGYQLAFFAIQGPAALASRPLDRLARRGGGAGRLAAHSITLLFLTATSVLFFHGVSEVFPWVLVNGSPLP